MDEKDCAVAYQELVEILNEHELGWLAEKVARTIEDGKTSLNYPEWKQDPHREFEEFTAREQLFVLIDTMENVLVKNAEMACETADMLREIGGQRTPNGMIVHSVDGSEKFFNFNPESVAAERQNAQELMAILEEMRKETANNVN